MTFNILGFFFCHLGVLDSSEKFQGRCGLKWKEMQRENDESTV